VVLLFAQLLLMSGSTRGISGATVLESRMMRLTSPVVGLGNLLGRGFNRSFTGVIDLLGAHSRNAVLEGEVEQLRSELARYREESLENQRLRQLMSMREDLAPASIAATVVLSSSTAEAHMIVIDRGAQHGVREDLPVVAWGGAVGRVVAVSNGQAKVRVLTDPNSGAAGIVQRSRVQGMVVGQGEEPLAMLYVPGFSDVTHGDRVVTSGLDGIFPRGFGVGIVNSRQEHADGSLTIQLRPEVDYRSLEEVLVLVEPQVGELLDPLRGEDS